jgi:acetolactate synthase small subunit
MSTTVTVPAPVTHPAGAAAQRLAVRLKDVPNAVVRVLGILQRRQCRVTSVDFAEGDHHRPGRLVVGVIAPPTHAHCVAAWVANLVDVLEVERLDE